LRAPEAGIRWGGGWGRGARFGHDRLRLTRIPRHGDARTSTERLAYA
jgi:hypothetical protein